MICTILDYIGRGIAVAVWLLMLAIACALTFALAPISWLAQWLWSHRR